MTHNEVFEVLEELSLPIAYDHFEEGESPDPPFICFRYPGTDHFSADGRVYYMIAQVNVEVYTDLKDPKLEERIEEITKGRKKERKKETDKLAAYKNYLRQKAQKKGAKA